MLASEPDVDEPPAAVASAAGADAGDDPEDEDAEDDEALAGILAAESEADAIETGAIGHIKREKLVGIDLEVLVHYWGAHKKDDVWIKFSQVRRHAPYVDRNPAVECTRY
jgi:hypothetical protein